MIIQGFPRLFLEKIMPVGEYTTIPLCGKVSHVLTVAHIDLRI